MWSLVLMGRLLVLVSLVVTAAISEYCLVLLAMTTYRESAWWVFVAIVAGLILVLSIPLVFQDLMEQSVRNFAHRHECSWLIMYLDATTRAARKCTTVFFGSGPLGEESDVEGDQRVQMIEAAMEKIASSTKDSLVESVEAAERRVKAHASAIGESIRLHIMKAEDENHEIC